jgi:ATP-dependent helicase Lhr and Lhr-like helicase
MTSHTAISTWFSAQGWTPLDFQIETWDAIISGQSGLVNAPTGSGKTYSVLLGYLSTYIQLQPDYREITTTGLKMIWVTPIRALAKEILLSTQRALKALGLEWKVESRTGDSSSTDKKNQWKTPPQILITTPESIHVMMTHKGYASFFSGLDIIVVDEWHELMGSKRGVQTELALSRLSHIRPHLKIWGISATIGNMQEAIDVLLYRIPIGQRSIIRCDLHKDVVLHSILPDEIETFPWAGHLGLKMADKVVDIIHNHKTTLVFTNTRAQCEIWYQKLLDLDPDLSGQMAMHHGSISKDIREWVEEALYEGHIRAVVCTSSLDLGVDFRPVETIIQIGSPKGVAKFLQRAGRSGHQPFATSHIWFFPTHALELLEAAGLREAVKQQYVEERLPYIRSFDVLIQYLMTLAVSDGFDGETLYREVVSTYAYASLTRQEWSQVLFYLTAGASSLQAYDEYRKVDHIGDRYYVEDRRIILRHKLSIGTIASDAMISVRLVKGTYLGSMEEYFVSQLSPGDVFWFAGRALEFVRIKEMSAQVRLSSATSGKVPSYMGGRMSFTSHMSQMLKLKLYNYVHGHIEDIEVATIEPILFKQSQLSQIPKEDEFLIEYFEDKEGHHLLMYPFEGRNVHEGMASLIAKRLSMKAPITFTIAMNDLGFELLSDQPIDVDRWITRDLFSTKNLASDIQSSINAVELARRRFRDIARISGLIFTGYPGRMKKERHLQSSSQLIFDVFRQYETDNLLYQQAHDEVLTFQLEEARIRQVLAHIQNGNMIISRPGRATPFSFPILVDRLREKLSSERLEDRIRKMTVELTR